MLHFYDRAGFARASTLDLEPRLRALLAGKIAALPESLIDYTEYLVVEAGDSEDDIVRAVGLSPLVDPIDGVRFGAPGFEPHWDWLVRHDGWFEMVFTFGGAFAYVLLIDEAGFLARLCRRYCRE